MSAIKGYAAGFFIFAVIVLGIISILGVWDVFGGDVIWKSFYTIGLLAVVALIIAVAGQAMDSKAGHVPSVPDPIWASVRKGTLGVLIGSLAILALLGILTIWEVISNHDVLYKSMGSMAILAFVSLIIVVTCRSMEGTDVVPLIPPMPPVPPVQG